MSFEIVADQAGITAAWMTDVFRCSEAINDSTTGRLTTPDGSTA